VPDLHDLFEGLKIAHDDKWIVELFRGACLCNMILLQIIYLDFGFLTITNKMLVLGM
jgi:hypothetical protein